MRAVRIHRHGGPEVLQLDEIDPRPPGPCEVAIEVKACALNHLDLWVRKGLPNVKFEMPRILGSDVSGVVAEVGAGVTGVSTGEEVVLQPGLSCDRCLRCLEGRDNECRQYKILGSQTDGGYTERLNVPTENVLPKPKQLSFEEAASVPLVFLTAWHMLVARAHVQPGEDVLVLAAGSGVGIAAIQIARLYRARVIATASTDAKLAKARELGADEIINYRDRDFAQEVRRLTNKNGVDVAIDHVGKDTFGKTIACLARGGRLVTCGATSGPDVDLDLRYVFARHLSLLGSHMGGKHELARLLPFFETGALKPVVDRVYSLEDAADAHRRLENREQFGKIVLRI